MELHCHWPVQTTKMEERNGGFHAPAHRPVKWVCAFSQITLINQNVLLNNTFHFDGKIDSARRYTVLHD